MTRYLLTAALLFGLTGLTAVAQTAPPIPNDPNALPGTVPSTPPTFPTERQSTNPADQDRNRDTNAPDQSGTRPTDADADKQTIGNPKGQSDNAQMTDSNSSSSSDYESQLRNALQAKPSLAGVQATFTDTAVELSGTVPTAKDRMQARAIAQSYANGRKITDHIAIESKNR